MSSSRIQDRPASFPHVPDTLRAEPSSSFNAQKPMEPRADTAPYITPYLSLRSRLSQIWINRWTILLLLVLVRTVLLIAQVRDNIGDAEAKALSACNKVEDIGSAVASMPYYLSFGVNNLAASGITKAVHGMVDMLDLVIQGVQAIIIFYINFVTATYTCLITALIHGSLDVVASVTQDATKAFNNVVDGAAGEIEQIAGGLEDAINKLTQGIQNSIFGNLIPSIPTVNFTEPIDKLRGFNLSTDGFVKDVQKLNDDLPNFQEVQNLTKTAISFPFNILRRALNESYGNFKFDKGVFPLAQKQQLTFCSDNDTLSGFFRHLYSLVDKARIVFIVFLSVVAAAAMAPMAWLEIRRWRRQQQHAKLVTQNQYDPMDVIYISSRPFTATSGIKLASRFEGKRQILTRWCIAYATSPPALFVLSLALTGFFSCLCQLILLKAIQKEVPVLANKVGVFTDEVVTTLEKASMQWATDANGVITGLNNDINNDLLVYVSNATDAVNNTINLFLDKMEQGLELAFNGTILLDPIKSILYCVVGLKIESVQKGLTWVHDHAHVSLPLFPNDTFSLGANESISGDSDMHTFLASPSSVTTDEVTGAVEHVTKRLHNSIVQEALLSTGIFLVYVIVVLIGVVRTLAGMCTPERGRAEGGIRHPTQHQSHVSPAAGFSQPQDEPPAWDDRPPMADSGDYFSDRRMMNEKMAYEANATSTHHEHNPYEYKPHDHYDEKMTF